MCRVLRRGTGRFVWALSITFIGACTSLLCHAVNLPVYTWREDTARSLPGAVPMVWASLNYGANASPPISDYHSARDPKVVAAEVAQGLLNHAAADRVVFLWQGGVIHGDTNSPALFPNDLLNGAAYAKGGFTEFTRKWMTEFWQELARRKVKPSLIILDYEDADGFWGVKMDYARDSSIPASAPDWVAGPAIALSKIAALLGHAPAGIEPLNYVRTATGWGWNRDAIVTFNNWHASRRTDALRKSIFEPAWLAFGEQIPSSNYGEQYRLWTTVDLNDWAVAKHPISGTVSSPATYLGIGGQRYSVGSAGKSKEFLEALNWVDKRNEVRSAIATGNTTIPWYSNPNFGCDSMQDAERQRLHWAAGLLHDYDSGIAAVLFWSAAAWTPEENFIAARVLAHINSNPPRLRSVGPLSTNDPASELAPWIDLAEKVLASPAPPTNVRVL
jgi:hypothetical protein